MLTLQHICQHPDTLPLPEGSTNLGLPWWRSSGEQHPRDGTVEAFNHASNLNVKCLPTGKPGCTVRNTLTNQRRGTEAQFWYLLVALTYQAKYSTTKKGDVLAFITMIPIFPEPTETNGKASKKSPFSWEYSMPGRTVARASLAKPESLYKVFC